MSARTDDVAAALAVHHGDATVAWAPGRCCLVGDHLDYAGGRVLACALDIGVAVAAAPSSDASWRVRSGPTVVVAPGAAGEGIARLPLAAVTAMRDHEAVVTAPLDLTIVASLPFSAGLSSSAALTCAVICCLLHGDSLALPARRLADLAWIAEHDIAGVPCGRLDQRAVVEAPASGICAVDLGTDLTDAVAWPWDDVALVVIDSAERHDVGAPEYAALRRDAEAVLAAADVASVVELAPTHVAALPPGLRARGEHLVAESRHVREAEAALAEGDRVAFGRALSASHRDQRRLLGNTTARVEAIVDAALAVPGCHGARMVGAGFGGSVLAVCDAAAIADLQSCFGGEARTVAPSPGLAVLDPEAVLAPTLGQP